MPENVLFAHQDSLFVPDHMGLAGPSLEQHMIAGLYRRRNEFPVFAFFFFFASIFLLGASSGTLFLSMLSYYYA